MVPQCLRKMSYHEVSWPLFHWRKAHILFFTGLCPTRERPTVYLLLHGPSNSLTPPSWFQALPRMGMGVQTRAVAAPLLMHSPYTKALCPEVSCLSLFWAGNQAQHLRKLLLELAAPCDVSLQPVLCLLFPPLSFFMVVGYPICLGLWLMGYKGRDTPGCG